MRNSPLPLKLLSNNSIRVLRRSRAAGCVLPGPHSRNVRQDGRIGERVSDQSEPLFASIRTIDTESARRFTPDSTGASP